MNAAVREISVILTAIIGLAIVATLVSRQAQTPQVISSAGDFFTNALRAATGPVSGNYGLASGWGSSTF